MKENTNSLKHKMEICSLHRDREIKNHTLHIIRKLNSIMYVQYLSALIHGFSSLLQQTIDIHILRKGKSPSVSRNDRRIKYENIFKR